MESVDRNARKIGRTAARILDRLMEGEAISPGPVLLDPGMVIERQSTGLRYTPDPLVTRAVRLLEETLHEAPKADQVCAHLKVSRSTLENRFRQTLDSWASQKQEPLIVMGDFNSQPKASRGGSTVSWCRPDEASRLKGKPTRKQGLPYSNDRHFLASAKYFGLQGIKLLD
jgi:hypothetical protein